METKKEDKSLTLNIPTNNLFQIVLIVLLVAGAYMLGSLSEKVKVLQGGGTLAAGQAAGTGGAAAPQAPAAVPTAGPLPKITNDDHTRGSKNAKIALVEYSDLECPFCKTFHPTAKQILQEYPNDVMWVYRHYPLSFHANAQKEAEASECAAELGGNDAFWKYADTIYERTTSNGTGFALDALVPLAKEIGLDEAKFKDCLDSGKYTKKIQQEENEGTTAGVTGTPGNILLNIKTGETRVIPGAVPFDQIKPVIDEMLKG